MRSRRNTLAIPALALALLLAVPAHASALERWTARTVTAGTPDHSALDISGDRLVWVEAAPLSEPYRTGGRVFTWKAGHAQPAPLSAGQETYGEAPRVSGDRVAWSGSWAFLFEPVRHVEASMYAWTPSAGRSAIADGPVLDAGVSGDRVVWRRDADPTALAPHPYEILTWRPSEGVTSLALGRGGPPAVSGDRVAWWDGSLTEGRIHTWVKGSATPVAVSADIPSGPGSRGGNYQMPVRVSGDRIVWAARAFSGSSSTMDVYTWTPSAGAVRLTFDGLPKSTPEVSGDRIVWAASSGRQTEVYTWTPATGVRRISRGPRTATSPDVSGDRVVWSAGPIGHRRVFTWTPTAGVSPVTNGRRDDVDPVVSGERIAWRSGRRGAPYAIATATLSNRRPLRPRR